jgi:hypothetical protein
LRAAQLEINYLRVLQPDPWSRTEQIYMQRRDK